MKAKPIIFSTDMVRAILEDRKGQTRRVVKGKRDKEYGGGPSRVHLFSTIRQINGVWHGCDSNGLPFINDPIQCPYQPGDILWVRETWALQECEKCRAGIPALGGECRCDYVYRTNYGKTEDDTFPPSMYRWKPNIHMPREAARIFLKVTGVWPERVQDITHAGALAEGIPLCPGWKFELSECDCTIAAFADLWNRLNAKRGFGWDNNPFCWVTSFERVNKDEAMQ